MKITKKLIPKKEDISKRNKEKYLTTTFDINKENKILKNILQKNSSLRNLKEKIQKESNNNIHEIFSSDESRQKAIKYVINASKGKENQKNYANQNNNMKSKKYISNDIPLPDNCKNKIKVKRNKNGFYNKIEQLSPIKKEKSKNKFFNEDKPLNEEDLLRDNNMLSNMKDNKNINDSYSLIYKNQSYDISSQREFETKYIQQKNNMNKYNFYNNNHKKTKYFRKREERQINPFLDYNYQNRIADDNIHNRTLNNFYIHKIINKPGLSNTKLNEIINEPSNHQIIFSNKDNIYDISDIKYNIKNYNHRKNISEDGYYNMNLNRNKNSFFETEANDFYYPRINRLNYIDYSSTVRILEGGGRKKNIIRIVSNNHSINDINSPRIKKRFPLKKKNNSFFVYDSIPIKLNQITSQDYSDTEYYNNRNKNCNTINNNYSFHKKKLTNINNKKTSFSNNNDNSNSNLDNIENLSNNRILVKKRPLKENYNFENSINNNKNIYNKLYICTNNSFNYKQSTKNKIIFENENEIIDYINKKYEKNKNNNNDKNLEYTGFILTKKLNGKTLYEIKIEDNLDKINKQLKEDNIKIENKFIEIISNQQKEEFEKIKNELINMEKEMNKIKLENDSLTKKDYLKNELIKKLDNEKQLLTNENKNLLVEIEKIKQLNDKLNENLIQYDINNIKKKYKIENIISINVNNKIKLLKENNEINKTPKSFDNSNNNLSINLNISNMDMGIDSKKINPLSVFRLSKVSEIKEIKIDNPDSGDKEIKNNLDLLNGKSDNSLNINNNNGEIHPFNENTDY